MASANISANALSISAMAGATDLLEEEPMSVKSRMSVKMKHSIVYNTLLYFNFFLEVGDIRITVRNPGLLLARTSPSSTFG